MIKVKTEQVIEVRDWDDLVEKTYGKPYSFQQQDGCKERQRVSLTVPGDAEDYENDTLPEVVNHREMGVSFAAWLARDPKQNLVNGENSSWNSSWRIDLWWERNFYPEVGTIANDLHARGLLPTGEYSIDIDW